MSVCLSVRLFSYTEIHLRNGENVVLDCKVYMLKDKTVRNLYIRKYYDVCPYVRLSAYTENLLRNGENVVLDCKVYMLKDKTVSNL